MRNREVAGRYCYQNSAAALNPRPRGYVLIALCLGMLFLLGVLGLAIDIGRMYITQDEAQSFADTAAVSAALQLDGSSAGITRAQSAVSSDPKKWGFQNNSFGSVTTQFATSSTGAWVTSPTSAAGYYFVRVQTSVSLPMYLMGALAKPTGSIGALAVAGRSGTTTVNSGGFPFSPYTRAASPDNASDPFGYQVGNQYTLRWGAPGNRTTCGTDATQPNLSNNGKIRGYCCVAESGASLRQAIVGGATDPETVGSPINMDNGAKDTEMSAIAQRVEEDTDTASTTYAQYLSNGTGNGERVVFVPVNGGAPNYINMGFAGFFLLNDSAYTGLGGNDSACGEYIGTYVQGAAGKGQSGLAAGGSGAYHIKLYQ